MTKAIVHRHDFEAGMTSQSLAGLSLLLVHLYSANSSRCGYLGVTSKITTPYIFARSLQRQLLLHCMIRLLGINFRNPIVFKSTGL